MTIHEIQTVDMIEKVAKACEDAGKYLIVKCSATWCGPCKAIAPKFKEIAEHYSEKATFVQFDVDDHQELAEYFDVRSMPTIYVIENMSVVKKLEGGGLEYLRALLDT